MTQLIVQVEEKESISSGGVVIRLNNNSVETLLLRDSRYEDWTLPKGHIEGNETLQEAAMREIKEEVGVTEGEIMTELGVFRRYVEKAQEWKTIHYFLVVAADGEPKGNLENEYMETRWFSVDALPKMYLAEQEKVIRDNLPFILGLKKDLSQN